MKSITKVSFLALALLWVSCSKHEHGAEVESLPSSSTSSLMLNIETELNDEELSELRNLQLYPSTSENGRPRIKSLTEGQTIHLHLVFSDGTNTVYKDNIAFTVREGKLIYKGDIDVPNYNGSRAWYVTAFRAGVLENRNSYAYAPSFYEMSSRSSIVIAPGANNFNIPYVSPWTRIQSHHNTKARRYEGFIKLKLKPMGHILRVQLHNDTRGNFTLKGFDMVSDDFWFDVRLTPQTNIQSLQSGAYPTVSKRGENSSLRTVPDALINAGQTSSTYWLWIMPSSKVTTLKQITLRAHGQMGSRATRYYPFRVNITADQTTGLGGISGLKILKLNRQ